ncbi:hypothetical protein KCP73_18755 [Salmonella enterica subsp. enterica]|nr:hypothetical protein KCP73_18755 [Salmonella enterica subsp. enterica]
MGSISATGRAAAFMPGYAAIITAQVRDALIWAAAARFYFGCVSRFVRRIWKIAVNTR